MALDIFSIPAMSADPEWLFSSSKQVLKDTCNRLKSDALEALECLKSWAKEGILLSNFYRFNTFPEDNFLADYGAERDSWELQCLCPVMKYGTFIFHFSNLSSSSFIYSPYPVIQSIYYLCILLFFSLSLLYSHCHYIITTTSSPHSLLLCSWFFSIISPSRLSLAIDL